MLKSIFLRVAWFVSVLALPLSTSAQGTKPVSPKDWQQLLDLAKQEGKVVVSIPPSAELRKGIEEAFTKLFVNWFLGKEGQEVYTAGMGEPTRRLDVETK
jgi:hypothetical protein